MKRTESWEQQTWVTPYRTAIVELEQSKLPERIETAKSAINARIEELEDSPNNRREQRALLDALDMLRILTENYVRKSA